MKQYIAYKGNEFSIEWYFDVRGQSLALEYFKKQPLNKQRKVLNLFRLMGDQGKIFDETKFRNEEDKIYAFKPQPDRYLCFFFRGKKIIVTNAFTKKSQKMPKGEKELAVIQIVIQKSEISQGDSQIFQLRRTAVFIDTE